MTHYELLALINARSNSNEVHALRGIVELHYPYEVDGVQYNCHECDWAYPCFTIKTIEGELV